jgi:very-short-patch-repair endonuclease
MAGIGRSASARLVHKGILYPILPRVYAVGHPALAPLALELAVVLHLGHDAVISHQSAAMIWGLTLDRLADVHATIVGRDARPHPGLTTHRVPELDRRDVRIRDGIPVTAPARTLIDHAALCPDAVLERGISEARVMRLISDRELAAAITRCPWRTGLARVRALLEAERGTAPTRSEAERRLLALVAGAQLPRPDVNARVLGHEVDFLWRSEKLVVEVDGHAFHAHRAAFERDRTRDQVLVAAGYRVIRVTWRQLIETPIAVAARIAQALAWAAARG